MQHATQAVRELLRLASASRGRAVDDILAAVASTVSSVLGYRTVVLNLYRPAWDDTEVVVVHSDDPAAERTLLGNVTPWSWWEQFLKPEFEHEGAYFLPAGTVPEDAEGFYVPDLPAPEDPTQWHPMDGLYVPLSATAGEPLGTIAVDDPVSGLRPTAEDMAALVAIASHAAIALDRAREADRAEHLRGSLGDLVRVSTRTTDPGCLDATLDELCGAIQHGLGFERVVLLVAGPDGDRLAPRASRGFEPETLERMREMRLTATSRMLDPRFEREGCQLLSLEDGRALSGAEGTVYSSQRNGRGPRAWRGHWLFAPVRAGDGRLIGALWCDDPTDRLLPSREELQTLRLFADQAGSALSSAAQLAHLRYLASHDELTGVHNRRDLPQHIDGLLAEGRRVAVLTCDLDHFKRVNDELGHDVGDTVLRAFGALLREHAGATGRAVRLGGEEFCLVLPDVDGRAALAAAERLRLASHERLGELVAGVTLSVGIAASRPGLLDASAHLLPAADQALYAAKRLGRDRCVVYDPALPALARRSDEGQAVAQQLSAVLLLADALDLRDSGTSSHSRTVADLARRTAQELGLEPARVERLRIAGALHDIGKIGVPDHILKKPGRLEPEEWDEMRRHAEVGASIVAAAGLDDIAGWVRHHHERVDGAGYPDGLAGDEIALEARVLAVVDAYEAMTADRPYREALGEAEARAELERCAGTQFDHDVVAALLRVLAPAQAAA